MKSKKYISLINMAIILILEILPYGAVLNFGRPPEEGGAVRETYSYFNLTPFGYANFGPFLTAIISCLILIFILISLFTKGQKLWNTVKILSVIGIVTSIMPLMFGINYYTVIGLVITVLLAVQFIISITDKKGGNLNG